MATAQAQSLVTCSPETVPGFAASLADSLQRCSVHTLPSLLFTKEIDLVRSSCSVHGVVSVPMPPVVRHSPAACCSPSPAHSTHPQPAARRGRASAACGSASAPGRAEPLAPGSPPGPARSTARSAGRSTAAAPAARLPNNAGETLQSTQKIAKMRKHSGAHTIQTEASLHKCGKNLDS